MVAREVSSGGVDAGRGGGAMSGKIIKQFLREK